MRKGRKRGCSGVKKEKYEGRNKLQKKGNLQIRKQSIQSRATKQKILKERKCINTMTKFTLTTYKSRVCILKGKAIPLQAWTGPEDSRRLGLPDFKTIGT